MNIIDYFLEILPATSSSAAISDSTAAFSVLFDVSNCLTLIEMAWYIIIKIIEANPNVKAMVFN